MAALALEGIRVTFVSQDGGRYTAIDDTTLRVAPGEFVSVVGPTGCGKSTLLNVAAGLLQPSAGGTSVFGERLSGLNRKAGYLFQSEALMPWRTALQNVTVGLEFRGADPAQATAQAEEWLRRVGLGGFGGRYPHQLSGGMRKRVALAQALILDPEIILMDEPFAALDIQTRHLMENELLELWSANRKSVIFITHDRKAAIEKGRAMMSDAGLSGVEHNYPGEVSSGMRRRVEIVRALMNDPKALLLDEPYRALDSLTKSVMHEALLEIYYKNKVTIFFITHDLEEAISLSDRVVVMSAGPESHPIGEFAIDLPRPRDVAEIRLTPRFIELHGLIWAAMKEEVLKSYARQRQ
jgi:NitT/TauT family transport system ATP-binding protein